MTESFASTKSTLRDIDEQVREIMQGHEQLPHSPASEGMIIALVNSLSEHITSLKNEIKFLQSESLAKNGTIGYLISELSKYRHDPLDSSADLDAILADLSLRDVPLKCSQSGDKQHPYQSTHEKQQPQQQHEIQQQQQQQQQQQGLLKLIRTQLQEHEKQQTHPQHPSTDEQLVEYRRNKQMNYQKDRENLHEQVNENFGAWENHSTKFGSRQLSKWGYIGGGLGKNGDGITSPVKAAPTNRKYDEERWPENTVLIIGDSMINGIEEQRLRRYNARVVPCPGATIKDVYRHITPLLKKKPSKVIIHVGTNDAPYKPSVDIVKELILLRKFVENSLPGSKIHLSSPVMRSDNQLANSTIRKVFGDLQNLPNVILNDKLDGTCLGRKGLHLNRRGLGKLAMNFISQMQCV